MTYPLVLPKGSVLYFDNSTTSTPSWQKISEHNRQEFLVGSNRIEQSVRMANGTLRKYYITDKKTYSTSWSMLPSTVANTVDGGWGASEIKSFYEGIGKGAFKIKINYSIDGTDQSSTVTPITVMFKDCSFNLVKRGIEAHWNVSISLEEV